MDDTGERSAARGESRSGRIVVLGLMPDRRIAGAIRLTAGEFRRLFREYAEDPSALLARARAFDMLSIPGGAIFAGGLETPVRLVRHRQATVSLIRAPEWSGQLPTCRVLTRNGFITELAPFCDEELGSRLGDVFDVSSANSLGWAPGPFIALFAPLEWVSEDDGQALVRCLIKARDEAAQGEVEEDEAAASQDTDEPETDEESDLAGEPVTEDCLAHTIELDGFLRRVRELTEAEIAALDSRLIWAYPDQAMDCRASSDRIIRGILAARAIADHSSDLRQRKELDRLVDDALSAAPTTDGSGWALSGYVHDLARYYAYSTHPNNGADERIDRRDLPGLLDPWRVVVLRQPSIRDIPSWAVVVAVLLGISIAFPAFGLGLAVIVGIPLLLFVGVALMLWALR